MNTDAIHSLIDNLAQCTATPGKGVTRLSYSPEDAAARRIVLAELAALGLESATDWAGNLYADLPGSDPSLQRLIVASHLDSVRHGGRFDGTVGVVGALAVLRRLLSRSAPPRRTVRFVAFAEEEGANFNLPLLGSKAFAGALRPDDLSGVRDGAGRAVLDVLRAFGLEEYRPSSPDGASGCGCMLELHVEQSGQLEAAGAAVGAVDVIVADYALTVTVGGRAGHSGATPMDKRRDALAGAAEMILACERLGKGADGCGAVLTVGKIACQPNAFNCIAQQVVFTVDLRHPDPDTLAGVVAALERELSGMAARRGLTVQTEQKFTPGATMDPLVRERIASQAARLGLTCISLPSWAMHDSGALAGRLRAGMIFVPSRDGLSHHPDEYTPPAAVAAGVELLCAVAAELADDAAW